MPRVSSSSTEVIQRVFPCTFCLQDFPRLADLKRHMVLHDPNKENRKIPCYHPLCSYGSLQRSNVDAHFRAAHQGMKPYVCGVGGCPKAYGYRQSLKKHQKTQHGAAGRCTNSSPTSNRTRRRASASTLCRGSTWIGHGINQCDLLHGDHTFLYGHPLPALSQTEEAQTSSPVDIPVPDDTTFGGHYENYGGQTRLNHDTPGAVWHLQAPSPYWPASSETSSTVSTPESIRLGFQGLDEEEFLAGSGQEVNGLMLIHGDPVDFERLGLWDAGLYLPPHNPPPIGASAAAQALPPTPPIINRSYAVACTF